MHSREALDRPIPPQIKEFRQRGQAQHGCLHTVQAQQTPRPRPTGPAREQRHGGSVTVCHGERRHKTQERGCGSELVSWPTTYTGRDTQ